MQIHTDRMTDRHIQCICTSEPSEVSLCHSLRQGCEKQPALPIKKKKHRLMRLWATGDLPKKRQTIPLTAARCQRACCMTWSRTTSAAEILYMVSETNLAYLHFIKVKEGGSAGERLWQWAESCRRRQEKVSGTAVEIRAGCHEHLPSVWPLWAGQEAGMLLSKTQREAGTCVCVYVCAEGGGVPCSMLLKP